LGGVPAWLATLALVLEVIGFVSVAVTVWALWPASTTTPTARPRTANGSIPGLDVDVLVRCSGQDVESLRATLISSRDLGWLYVLDLNARPEIAAVALEAGAVYIATDPDDLDGLGQALVALAAPTVLLLEAGDVPRADIVTTLAPWLDEPDVAVVQGPVLAAERESAEHDAGRRHERELERRALLPSLGSRGVAAFAGSGALVRRAALTSLTIGHATPPMVEAEITAELFAHGWRVVAPGGDPVVAVATQQRVDVAESTRAAEASGALHLLTGPNGAFRGRSLRFRQRLALVAHAVRPLSGIRRSLVIGVLLVSLLSGSLPFTPSAFGLVALWTPWFVLTAVGLWMLSDGALRPGDRLRGSMRLLGASWRGVMSPNGRPERPQYSLAEAFGVHSGVAAAMAVGAISVVVGMRGVSDRLTHTLAPLPSAQSAGLLVVSLWSLGGGLDALRLLVRRASLRRATRVASSLPSTFGDRAALIVDLTAHGAGVISEVDREVGATDELDLVVPTASGCVTARLPIVVRNVRDDFSGDRRYGVEFESMPPYVAEALAEYCVVQPAIEQMGGPAVDTSVSGRHPLVLLDDRASMPRRIGLRAAALIAVAGAIASSMPGAAEASGGASMRLSGRVVVAGESVETTVESTVASSAPEAAAGAPPTTGAVTVDSVDIVVVDTIAAIGAPAVPGGEGPEGAVVTVVCSTDAGPDGFWGTSDDVYTAPVSTVARADGSYDVATRGEACWMSVAPPTGYMVPGETSDLEAVTAPQVVDLSTSTTEPVEIVPTTRIDATAGPVRFGDVVWADTDSDSVLDADEAFVGGVSVRLFAPDGVVQASATTSAEGRYEFSGVPEGEYRIGVSNLPEGMVTTGVLGLTAPFTVTADSTPGLAIGLRPAPRVVPRAGGADDADGGAPGAVPSEQRLLPQPSADQLAPTTEDSPAASLAVVLLASLMGLSVVAGSVRPGRAAISRHLQTSR
ncbi:MAG: carboxypeptidase regulatory-like domain-containing protein, partial [Actinobacteria bacterium]|nr:carboxypeptidase regulatory-like domain-containing protein [Actinomycetota bacterium]